MNWIFTNGSLRRLAECLAFIPISVYCMRRNFPLDLQWLKIGLISYESCMTTRRTKVCIISYNRTTVLGGRIPPSKGSLGSVPRRFRLGPFAAIYVHERLRFCRACQTAKHLLVYTVQTPAILALGKGWAAFWRASRIKLLASAPKYSGIFKRCASTTASCSRPATS